MDVYIVTQVAAHTIHCAYIRVNGGHSLITQADVAGALGYSTAKWSRLLAGLVRWSLDDMISATLALGFGPDEVLAAVSEAMRHELAGAGPMAAGSAGSVMINRLPGMPRVKVRGRFHLAAMVDGMTEDT